ncbi:phospho-sugar mutase [Shewanella surugensis]|uniref:Phospho-sugar mutase n=1 Tax=Shewanella surugensis TaxID=212020 RepID=A0ABT0LID8_9GAMM|nr:phospho-sugar mutase [Shewanella surugensis]MCL1127471.1 phospho-sugar mutase [Shewanella surugensis]
MNTVLMQNVQQWLERDLDGKTKQELQGLIDKGDEVELMARFSNRLAFGTAGLRGIVGAGPMRMNRLVVQQTSAGLGRYLKQQVEDVESRGVVIGYDGRHDSKLFAEDAAGVLLAMGIKVYLTYQTAPTPLVAFGVTHLKAAAGIVVTASHNPPQYNGYKVYWSNGAQIIAPHDAGIAECINEVAENKIPVQALAFDDNTLENNGLESHGLVMLEADFYHAYCIGVHQAPELNNHTQPSLVSLAYTAMHGVGAGFAETILKEAGFDAVYSVKAQREADGDFPTVNFPNPEEKGAMDLVIAEAKKYQATLACANDPDADRFAVAVRRDDGEYQMLTGDQVGVLLGHYLLSFSAPTQRLTCASIVSSSLLAKIAVHFNGQCCITLTGFKWLMNVAMAESRPERQFLFAYEEALGYCIGDLVKDKDGLSALLAFAQLTAELASQGQTIWDRLHHIYQEYGFHLNEQVSIALQADTPNIGGFLRENRPEKIAHLAVLSIDDFSMARRFYADGTTELLSLPLSDVLIYQLEKGARVIIRPSGTEPKLKCYYEVVETMKASESLEQAQTRAQRSMATLIHSHQMSLPS